MSEKKHHSRKRLGRKFFLKGGAYFAAFALMFVFYAWLYVDIFSLETPKHARLRKENAELRSRIDYLNRRVGDAEAALDQLNLRDNDVYRSIFGMEPLSDDVRKAGYGGTDRFEYLSSSDFSGHLTAAARHLNIVNKMAYVQSKSLDDIKQFSGSLGEMGYCMPNIMPVYKERVRLSSPFGHRVDPVDNSFSRMHDGVDLSGSSGLPIFSTGRGVVADVVRSREGYGNFILIDHGFGYYTRYAHLDVILVSRGQTVERGEQIATLGNTGRSNGPHLHYEVIYRGRHVNPLNYYDDDISKEEYASMVKLKVISKEKKKK